MSVVEQASINASSSPGATLRETRQKAGLTLEAVAQRTMIPASRLRALENDDYERVGVPTFVVGYTRSYARFLGIDPSPLVRYLEDALPKAVGLPVEKPSVALALQVQKRPRSFFWPVVWGSAIVLVLVAYIGMNSVSLVPPATDAPPVPATDNLATPVTSPAAPAAPADHAAASVVEGSLPSPQSEVAPTLRPVTANVEVAAAGADSVSVDAAVASAPALTEPDTLTMTFSGDCWISVIDATGKPVIARLATSSDNLRLFGQAPFEVVLGNAAVVTLAINGEVVDTAPQPGRKSRRLKVGEPQIVEPR